jgi:hypothetical protein
MSIVIEEFRALAKNTLCGFARVRLASGMVLHDVAIHQRESRAWASPPGRPMIGRDGTQMRAADGKVQFAPTITFADRATGDRFSEAVIAALREAHPEALR